jgi:hypothetical protein
MPEPTMDYEAAWKKLRTFVERQRAEYDGAGSNKDARTMFAGMTSAYGSVSSVMDWIEAKEKA